MKCIGCGRQIPDESRFCQHCGHKASGEIGPIEQLSTRPPAKSSVTPVMIAIIAIVIVSVIFSMLYVGGVLDEHPPPSPITQLSKTLTVYGVRFSFTTPSAEVHWSDVTIVLSDGGNSSAWHTSTDDLDSGTAIVVEYGYRVLPPLVVYCNVTDYAGDGIVGNNDCFTLTTGGESTYSANTEYAVTVVFEPYGSLFCQTSFRG
jgi:hypothetical protein